MNLFDIMGGSRYDRRKAFIRLIINLLLLFLVILLILDDILYEQISRFIKILVS